MNGMISRAKIEDAVEQYNSELKPGEPTMTVDEYIEIGAFMGAMETGMLAAQRYDTQYGVAK